MQLLFILMMALALSLEIFSVVAERGANIVKLDRKMTVMSLIWAALELLAAIIGYGLGVWVKNYEMTEYSSFWIDVLAGVLLAAIGIRMLFTAFKHRTILEHRMENVDIQADALLSLRLCFQALLAGAACGISQFSLLLVIVAVFVLSMLFAVVGYVSGRAYGAQFSSKAVGVGGCLLCLLSLLIQFY